MYSDYSRLLETAKSDTREHYCVLIYPSVIDSTSTVGIPIQGDEDWFIWETICSG